LLLTTFESIKNQENNKEKNRKKKSKIQEDIKEESLEDYSFWWRRTKMYKIGKIGSLVRIFLFGVKKYKFR